MCFTLSPDDLGAAVDLVQRDQRHRRQNYQELQHVEQQEKVSKQIFESVFSGVKVASTSLRQLKN